MEITTDEAAAIIISLKARAHALRNKSKLRSNEGPHNAKLRKDLRDRAQKCDDLAHRFVVRYM